jgi:sporulation-control protein
MSLFKRMLASAGIGSAQVNTELDSAQAAPGGTISGTVYVKGGRVEQNVDRIYLFLKTQYVREHNDTRMTQTAIVAKYLIADGFTLQPEQTAQFPFRFTLPDHMPVTLRNAPVWVETGLDIENAVDPTDRDYIQVLPGEGMRTVLSAVELLGFRLREVTNDYAPRMGGPLPFVQEFEFVPGGQFRSRLDELEIMFFPKPGGLNLLLQIDRRARGFGGLLAEALDADERFVRLTLSDGELRRGPQAIAAQLENLISRCA